MTIKETEINRYLDNLGVKHACLGYRYLILAIQLKAEHDHDIGLMEIYRMIAKERNIRFNHVERAIRYAISPFGLTNNEFIAKSVDDIVYGPKTRKVTVLPDAIKYPI